MISAPRGINQQKWLLKALEKWHVEAQMLTTVEKQDALLVDLDEAPFIGISGRQMASLDRGTEVAVLGERGPYTIVCWEGRNGYVPSEYLVSPGEFVDQADGADESTETCEGRSKPSLNPFRFFSRQRAA
jgi:hypothetical protein